MPKWDDRLEAQMGVREGVASPMAWSEKPERDYDRAEERSDARITAQLGYMTEQLSITQKMFSELTNRLEPVLMPEMDDVNAIPNDPPRKMASELSNVIDDLNGQISRLQGRIMKVMDRIQL